jgi:hypothetical protein
MTLAMAIYNPEDWYWKVGGFPDNQVFASKRGQMVPVTDEEYRQWRARGNDYLPSRILNADELINDVFLPRFPHLALRAQEELEPHVAPKTKRALASTKEMADKEEALAAEDEQAENAAKPQAGPP